MLTSKERAKLRTLANPLDTILQVGKAGIGEQSRRNNARPEQDQERDRGEEQHGDDGVRFVGNEVADREYNTHDRQG